MFVVSFNARVLFGNKKTRVTKPVLATIFGCTLCTDPHFHKPFSLAAFFFIAPSRLQPTNQAHVSSLEALAKTQSNVAVN
jgi:hypothetical protein